MSTNNNEMIHLIPWKNKEDVRSGNRIFLLLKSIIFFSVIFFSGFIGFYVTMALMPILLIISPSLYRMLGDRIGAWWSHIPTFLCSYVHGINLVVTGDALDPRDGSALDISNHTTLFDWLFLWDFFMRQNRLIHEKIVLKDSLKWLPWFGWAMQAMKFIFVARNKDVDLPHLQAMMQSWASSRDPVQILIFPEGTINDEPGLRSSASYCTKAGRPFRRHSLYPREGGLSIIMQALRGHGLTSLYDLTIGYPDVIPRGQFFLGHAPREVHVHIRRYPIEEVPGDQEGLSAWLQALWDEKDKTLTRFYEQRESLADGSQLGDGRPVRKSMRHALQMWVSFSFLVFQVFLFYWCFTTFGSVKCLSFIFITTFNQFILNRFGGLERLELWRTGFLN